MISDAPSISDTVEEFLLQSVKYIDGSKPFIWAGSKENLERLIRPIFSNPTNDGEGANTTWCEDPHHNMFSMKCDGLTFKFYVSTGTVSIQGREEKDAKAKLHRIMTIAQQNRRDNNNNINDAIYVDDCEISDAAKLVTCNVLGNTEFTK